MVVKKVRRVRPASHKTDHSLIKNDPLRMWPSSAKTLEWAWKSGEWSAGTGARVAEIEFIVRIPQNEGFRSSIGRKPRRPPGGTFTINPTFGSALSQNGWLGFSRTPHSDAVFSGKIGLDERVFQGEPVGVGVQGSQLRVPATGLFNLDACILPEPGWTCYDHRSALLHHSAGLTFRKAVLWH